MSVAVNEYSFHTFRNHIRTINRKVFLLEGNTEYGIYTIKVELILKYVFDGSVSLFDS